MVQEQCKNGVEECEIPSNSDDYESTGLVPAYNPDTTGETDRIAMQQALLQMKMVSSWHSNAKVRICTYPDA